MQLPVSQPQRPQDGLLHVQRFLPGPFACWHPDSSSLRGFKDPRKLQFPTPAFSSPVASLFSVLVPISSLYVLVPVSSPKHGVDYDLPTVPGPPVPRPTVSTRRSWPPQRRSFWRGKAGIIRCSNSPCSKSFLHGSQAQRFWRSSGNFRHLNNATIPYPLPAIVDFTTRIAGSKFVSKLELRKGYLQIPMHPVNIPKTAIISMLGLIKFLRLPFGFRNTAQTL